ncbi:MAG: VF530 family protein [Daejeonella sp.]
MANEQSNNSLHGKTLENILVYLVDFYGFEKLGSMIRINCFIDNPGIKSSLKFLRKTSWARKKVEDLYLETTSK